MGHTIYYEISVHRWRDFKRFMKRVCEGLGYGIVDRGNLIEVHPPCPFVEVLILPRRGWGFVKTNLVEPCHSVYLLMLYSASSFGEVEVWED